MIKNHLKIARRNLLKNKSFSAINIIGLAIGMSAVLLIALWIQNQYRYDNFYPNQEYIYKLMNKTDKEGSVHVHDITMPAAGPALTAQFPEVEHAARMLWSEDRLFSYGDKNLKAKGNEVDPDFLDIFQLPILQGDPHTLLNDPSSIVLTESLAKSLFAEENPLHKTVILKNEVPYTVTGVIKDLSSYTDFNFKYLIPIGPERAKKLTTWNNNSLVTFVALKPNTDADAFNQKIKPLVKQHDPHLRWSSIFLHPMSKAHLYSEFENGIATGGKIEQVRLVGGIGLLILLIACINFVNLSTARSQKRSREVGVRKVIGASKKTLVSQFLFESLLLAAIAGVSAIVLTAFFLPMFNRFLDKPLEVNWSNPMIWITGFAFILITGVLAGIYPAFVLSAYQPLKTIRGTSNKPRRLFRLREGLVVVQFAIAVILIVATLVIRMQVQFAGQRDVGYQASQLMEIPAEGGLDKNYEALKDELINNRYALSVARVGGWSIAESWGSAGGNFSWEGATPEQVSNSFFKFVRTESDFVKTLGLTLVDGRDIDYARLPADSTAVLLNETAIERMGLSNPVGKFLKWGDQDLTIVGVIKDYVIDSPYGDVQPLLVEAGNKHLYNIVIRTNPQVPMAQTIEGIEKIIKQFNPAYPFFYKFVDQHYAKKFREEEQMGSLALLFSLLAIFISCLGLFGLATYMAETRVKEIGIRKVLGASVARICTMLSKDFVKLVVVALILAAPLAWWAMTTWLENFAYRIDLHWWMLALAGGMAISIAILTVGAQSVKAAWRNPVDSLRNE